MRILDVESDRALSRVLLYLTADEAREMLSALEGAILDHHAHEHVPSHDYSKEVTLCVYDPSAIGTFSERSRRLIAEDT